MNNKLRKVRWNAETGMVAGIFVGGLAALLVSTVTGNQSVWSWAIPVGLASGMAIGAGRQRAAASKMKEE